MANVNEISLKITADGSQAVTSMNRLGSETTNIVDKIKKNWLGMSATMVAAYATAMKAWSLAEKAAQFEEQKASLNSLAAQYNTTASAIISSIQQASQGMISMADAVDIAGEAMMKNLSPLQIIKLAEAAEVLSNISGQKVVDSFRNMTEAITLGRERALENAIGIIDLQARYGDLINKMSDTEKQAARYAIVMEKVDEIQRRLGPSTASTADKMERFLVTIDDLKLKAGDWIIRFFNTMYGAFQGTAAAALALSAGMFKLIEGITWLTDKVGMTTNAHQKWALSAEAAWNASIDLSLKARTNLLSFFDTAEKNLPKIPPLLRNTANSIGTLNKEIENLNKQLQDMTDKITLSETAQIIKRAEEFKKAEADKILIEKWVTAERLKIQQKFNEEIDKQNESDYQKFLEALDKKFEAEAALQKQISELHKQETEFRYEDSWQKMFDMANQIGGEMGQGMGMMATGMKGIMDIEIGQDPATQRMDALREMYMKHLADLKLISQEEVNLWRQKERNKQQIELENLLRIAGMEKEADNLRLQQTLVIEQQKLSIASNTFGMMAGIMQTFYALSGQQSKTAFAAYKAMAIAQATIDTYRAAQGAYAALSGIPYVGPALGIAAALAAIAIGIARVSAIASTQIGGGMAAPSGGGGYSYTSPTEPSWKMAEEKPKSQVINVTVYAAGNIIDNDAFARDLVLSIKKATKDGM